MEDILGRDIKDGDLCVCMALGADWTSSRNGMRVGVFRGASVVYLSSRNDVSASHARNIYLIENPTKQELDIKSSIQKILLAKENERKRIASLKTIPLDKLEVGGVYKDARDREYVYLGKRKIAFEDLSEYPIPPSYEEGNCFARTYDSKNKTTDEIIDDIFDIGKDIDVLKGNKKLIKMTKKINLEFPLTKVIEPTVWRRRRIKLTIV